MARKSTSGLATPSEKIAVVVDTTSQGELATDPIPHIKVNNANLAEIKSSLDEAVKGVRLLPPSDDYHRKIHTQTERTMH
jgi:hypothetical protein